MPDSKTLQTPVPLSPDNDPRRFCDAWAQAYVAIVPLVIAARVHLQYDDGESAMKALDAAYNRIKQTGEVAMFLTEENLKTSHTSTRAL